MPTKSSSKDFPLGSAENPSPLEPSFIVFELLRCGQLHVLDSDRSKLPLDKQTARAIRIALGETWEEWATNRALIELEKGMEGDDIPLRICLGRELAALVTGQNEPAYCVQEAALAAAASVFAAGPDFVAVELEPAFRRALATGQSLSPGFVNFGRSLADDVLVWPQDRREILSVLTSALERLIRGDRLETLFLQRMDQSYTAPDGPGAKKKREKQPRPITSSGLTQVRILLESRAPAFVPPEQIKKSHGGETKATAIISRLRNDHGLNIQSAREARRNGDQTAENCKGWRLV